MGNDTIWNEVDNYFMEKLLPLDSVLEKVLESNRKANLPEIDVSPVQGRLLYLLTKMKGAKNVLEIGTLGGYSTIWFARAISEKGKVYTLEVDPFYAEIAKQNIYSAGCRHKVEVLVGKALDSLPVLKEKQLSFDVFFIDADKQNNPQYLKWALELANPGALIIADNVVRNGEIIDKNSSDERVQGLQQFIDLLEASHHIESTAIQTVGSKGYDGFVIGIVKEEIVPKSPLRAVQIKGLC